MTSTNKNNKLLIIIPAYNEENTIKNVLSNLKSMLSENNMENFSDILVINDGSKDKTAEQALLEKVKVVNNIQNLGYGGSLQVGYRYALKNNYDFLIQMDADGQHDPNNVPKIFDKLNTQNQNDSKLPDIVLGSRFLEGSKSFKISGIKKFAIWYFSKILYLTTKQSLTDPTTGLQGLAKPVIYYYSQFNQFDDSYPDSNVLLEAAKAGFIISEVPAIMHARDTGTSMHSGFKPIYYMLHMTVSVLSVLLRKDLKTRRNQSILFTNGIEINSK